LRAFDALTRGFVAEQATRALRVVTAAIFHHASVRSSSGVTGLTHRAIFVDVANTHVGRAVAVTAVALGSVGAHLTEFLRASGAAAVAVHRIAVVATFARFDDAVAAASRDADMRIRVRVADFACSTIAVHVANTHVGRAVAVTAVALGSVGAHFTEFLRASSCAAVAVHHVAVIATFARFHDAVTAATRDAGVGIGVQVANVAHRAICVFVALAGAALRITRSAFASTRKCTRLADLQEAGAAATVSGDRIAIVAAFVHLEHAVSATRINADVGICARVAELSAAAVIVLITRADAARRIAETTFARDRRQAGLPEFEQALRGASVAIHEVSVVATFTGRENAVATTKGHAFIRIERLVAFFADCAIGIFVAGARIIRIVAELARALVSSGACFANFE